MVAACKKLSLLFFLTCALFADYSYNDHGNISTAYIPNNGEVKYTYDQLNRLSNAYFSDGKSFSYEYDFNSNLLSVTSSRGTSFYKYDGFNRLKKALLPNNQNINYEYDIVGRVSCITYPDHSQVEYTYDSLGRLISVDADNELTLYEYDDTTNLVICETLPNRISTNYQYTPNLQISQVQHVDDNGALIIQFNYDYDPAGNVVQCKESTPTSVKTISYNYDKLNRLVSAEDSCGKYEKYTYDGAGNRLSKITNRGTVYYTYDDHNRLIQANDTSYFYDAVGNLIKKTSPSQEVKYTYDPTGKLISYSNGKDFVNFDYDGAGNRIAKTVNGKTTIYINDPQFPTSRVLAEVDEAGQLKRKYVYGHSRISQEDANETSYLLYDQPGKSVSIVVNEDESISLAYDSFGNKTDNYFDASYGYNGEEYDNETGLIFLRNRYYDPSIGRFISPDYILGDLYNPQSLNPYVFVQNNPLTFVDPWGLDLKVPLSVFGNYPGSPIPNDYSRVGHGWIGGVDENSVYFDQGAWPGSIIRRDESTRSLCPSTVHMTLWVSPSQQQAAIQASSEPVWTIKNNCIDHAAKALDAVGYPHPSFKSAGGISMPKNFCNWIVNERNNIHPDFLPKPGDTLIDYSIPKPVVDSIPNFSKFGPFAPNYGGVLLNKSAEFFTVLKDIDGVLYDEQMGQMIMYGKKNVSLTRMDTDDLAVAVRSIYGFGGKSPDNPGVSMEPGPRPDKPKKMCMVARYFGATQNTRFGLTMYEADRLLKTLSIGIDNITYKPIKSSVPGYLNLQAIRKKEHISPTNAMCRLWFVPKKITLSESPDGTSMVFNDAQMQVLTESTLKKTIVQDKAAEKFAKHFTEHYDDFAAEYPVLNDLKRLGKITAVVKWVQENNLPFDLTFFKEYTPEFVNTPTHSPIAFQKERNQFVLGGVVYTLNNNNYTKEITKQPESIKNAILGARPNDEALTWNFGKGMTAVARNVSKALKVGQVQKTFIDLSYPPYGQVPLAFIRTYSSFNDKASSLGKGWEIVPSSLYFSLKKQRYSFTDSIQRELHSQITVRLEGYESIYKLAGLNHLKQPVYKIDGTSTYLLADNDHSFLLVRQNQRLKFNSNGQLTDILDRSGCGLHYNYKGNRLSNITDDAGRTITFKYVNNRLKSAISSSGKVISYEHTLKGQLKSISDQNGPLEKYKYDKTNRLIGIYNARGNQIFAAKYDQHNRATQQTIGAQSTSKQYDLKTRSALISSQDNTYEQHFDSQYRPKFIKNASGQKMHLSYGKNGLSQIKTTTGLKISYQCDNDGNVTEINDALQGRRRYTYNLAGQIIQETDDLGHSIHYQYGSNGLLTTIIQRSASSNLFPMISYRDYCLDSGLLKSVILPDGRKQHWSYNSLGLPIRVALPNGLSITTEYDEHSRQTSVNSCGICTSYAYDERDNLIQISNGNITFKMMYDQAGNLKSFTKANGATTKYHYDSHERIDTVKDAANNNTSYQYDQTGLQKVSFPNGSVREVVLDTHGRLVGMR